MILGIDASTNTVGWAFSESGSIMDAGFLNISKVKTNKEKGLIVVNFLLAHSLIHNTSQINLEAALSGFGGGRTSQQTIIILSRWNSILEYMLDQYLHIPVILCNVNSMRKKVFGKSRIKSVKPKEYVKQQIHLIVPNISKFEKLNRNGEWDAHNSDMYDAVVASLYSKSS